MAYNDLPRIPRPGPNWTAIVLVLLALIIVVPLLAVAVTDYLWYREVHRTDVYWTMFWGRWLIGLLVGGSFFLIVFVNVLLALRETPQRTWATLGQQLRARRLEVLDHTAKRVIVTFAVAVIGLFAVGVGKAAAGYWPQFLLFSHAPTVGTADPIFKHDVSFYLFRLPIWELLNGWLFFSLTLALVLTALVYLGTQSIRLLRGLTTASVGARVHCSILLAAIFLVKALGYGLARYGLLYGQHQLLVGMNYTDVHAKLPGLTLMLGLAVAAAAVTLISLNARNIKLLLWYVAGLLTASVLVLNISAGQMLRTRTEANGLPVTSPCHQKLMTRTRAAFRPA